MRMRKQWLLLYLLCFSLYTFGQTKDMLSVKSNYPVKTTVARLEAAIQEKGLSLFAVIDHAAAAEKAGLSLRPTTLVIFGNPKVGTLLMQSDQRMGIELPLKFLVTENEDGTVSINYNNPEGFAADYSLADKAEVIANVKKALAGLAAAAAE